MVSRAYVGTSKSLGSGHFELRVNACRIFYCFKPGERGARTRLPSPPSIRSAPLMKHVTDGECSMNSPTGLFPLASR